MIYLLFSPGKSLGQGNLLVTPKRVVFENAKRSEELNIANTGSDSATFLISFIQIRMTDDGTFEKIELPDSAQHFADKYLRLFPRSVTLGPNEAQTVKVQVTRKNELVPGEYRSHLYFRAVPKEQPLGEKQPETDAISVRMVPIFGISMPIIVRVGESNAKVILSDVTFNMDRDTIPSLKMTFNRTGNMSVYGDVSVDYISLQGKKTRVGTVKGLAVYTPNSLRHFNLLLNKVANVDYRSGKLHLVYSDQSVRPVILAEEEIVLGSKMALKK
ncbi:MAG: hypothetical protein WKF97_16095 [Chitinophagaceae bacterium]